MRWIRSGNEPCRRTNRIWQSTAPRVFLAVSPLKPRKQGFEGLDNGLC